WAGMTARGGLVSGSLGPKWGRGDGGWTSHSPTGSGPEGSSPNEVRIGSLVSLLPVFSGELCKRGDYCAERPLLWRNFRKLRLDGYRFCDEDAPKASDRDRPEDVSIADRSMTDAGASMPESVFPDAAKPYRVLARKYRPSSFEDLIGQDAVVRTVSNAFETGRIPQAWILTGVRGVGKTTTARILARALNYELPDGSV